MKPSEEAASRLMELIEQDFSYEDCLEKCYAIDIDPVMAGLERIVLNESRLVQLEIELRNELAEKDKEIERLTVELNNRGVSLQGCFDRIAALESENQLLKSNLENANENWRRVLEERDELKDENCSLKALLA